MEKAMRFEKFLEDPFLPAGWRDHEYWIRLGWDAASIGTIPAENAVVIPSVGKWPDGASGISVLFVSDDHVKPGCAVWESFPGEEKEAMIQFIPRPKPVWVPKDSDKVFALKNGFLCTGDIPCNGINENGIYVRINGEVQCYPKHLVKPFHESHIGKPWFEIPGGVE